MTQKIDPLQRGEAPSPPVSGFRANKKATTIFSRRARRVRREKNDCSPLLAFSKEKGKRKAFLSSRAPRIAGSPDLTKLFNGGSARKGMFEYSMSGFLVSTPIGRPLPLPIPLFLLRESRYVAKLRTKLCAKWQKNCRGHHAKRVMFALPAGGHIGPPLRHPFWSGCAGLGMGGIRE